MYSAAVEYLKKRFKPVDIEELKGMEFHQKVQSTETVEELGICLQKLCRKAFPSIGGKEFDRFLKGRFFQALLPKWQKKLGAPKSSDSFGDLYDRARTLERHEKQFADSAAGRKKSTTPSSERSTRSSGNPTEKEDPGHSHANRESKENDATPRSQWCYKCRKHGHLTRDCPQKGKSEASGRTARAAALVASPTEVSSPLSGFSVQQLEEHLAARKLSSESSLMEAVNQTGAEVDVVSSDPKVSRVVGPTPYFGIVVEGVQVYSGSQSTIISRPLLHQVARKLRAEGKLLPKLTKPTVRLYGKDGQSGRRELNITAQTELAFAADGKVVKVPVLIQPDSEQSCLLGMNAIPELGIQLLCPDGKPVCTASARPARDSVQEVSSVQLVQALGGKEGLWMLLCVMRLGKELECCLSQITPF